MLCNIPEKSLSHCAIFWRLIGITLRPSTQPHRSRVIVGNHTQLDGAVITSTADKDRNILDTGTLGWSDIQNQADYKSEHQSKGFNTGGPNGSNLLSNVGALPVSAAGRSGHAEGSTNSVVSKGWQMAYDQAIVRQGAAPYLAAKVKELTTGNAPYGELTDTQKLNNLMAHALLGGVVAELSGGSAAAGATGAVTGELAAPAIALALYGTADSDKLSPDQKANLSALATLATLASGIAAGVSSGSTSGAATGALAGKNAVENNSLSATQSLAFDKELSECRKSGGDCQAVIDKWKQVSDKQSAETDQKLKNDPVG